MADIKHPEEILTTADSIDSREEQFSEKTKGNVHVISTEYAPSEEALRLPPGAGGDGDNAFVTSPSVFDDPELRKYYWPRADYEGLHRFFPDFKWTLGEEKRQYPIVPELTSDWFERWIGK
jgi:hypothetical protein